MRNDDLLAALDAGMNSADAARAFGISRQRVSKIWHCARGDARLPSRVRAVGARSVVRQVSISASGCWEWARSRAPNGYGRLKIGTRTVYAHRAAWTLHFGPIPPGLFVCHRCDNPPCVRPDHLFLGTSADNVRDSIEKGRWGHRRPPRLHCGRGHERIAANLQPNGQCRPCNQAAVLRYAARRRERAHA